VVTVSYLVQIGPKNGFETEKLKKVYVDIYHSRYLPQPPTCGDSLIVWAAVIHSVATPVCTHYTQCCNSCVHTLYTLLQLVWAAVIHKTVT